MFASQKLVALVLYSAAAAALAQDPQTNYQLHCMGCHVADGSGLEGKVPSMRPTLVPLALFAEGRQYLVQVPGVAQSRLSDAETAALLNWMVHSLGDRAVPTAMREFTAQEVAKYRATRMVEVRETRAKLMARIRPGNP